MNLPPIVGRELRELARGVRFHWGRALVAGLAVVLCLQWASFPIPAAGLSSHGAEGFHMLGWLGFVLALACCVLTADCVSRERREGTLGLLFLTTLKGRDVVLGKFTALGALAFYALLGFTPMLMLPLMAGGVTGGEVMRLALALLNLSFISLAVGLWVSVRARQQVAALLTSFAVWVLLALGPIFLDLVAQNTGRNAFAALSPLASFLISKESLFLASPATYWLALGVAHLEGWLFVAAAARRLAQNWREIYEPRPARVAVPQSRRLIGAPRVLVFAQENRRRKFAPVARAILQLSGLREMAWFAAVVSVIGSIWSAFVMNRLGSVWAGVTVSVILALVSAGLFAFVGGRFLFEARRSGELELLLVTPVGARGILREQRLALLRILRAPIYLAVAGAVVVAVGSLHIYQGQEMLGLVFGLSATANAVLGVLAITWVGMWFGARANSSFAIIGCSVGLVEIVPLVAAYLLPLPFALTTGRGFFAFWSLVVPVFMVAKNFFFINWARRRLRNEFRMELLPVQEQRLAGAGEMLRF